MKTFIVSCCVLLVSLTAIGMADAKSSNTQQPFTADELDRFIADVPSMSDLAASAQQDMEKNAQSGDTTAAMSTQICSKYSGDIKKKGWDPDRFYYIYGHVVGVMAFLQMEKLLPKVSPQIAQTQQMIQNNPFFTKEQKKEMLKEMAQEMAEGNAGLREARAEMAKEVPVPEVKLIRARQDDILKSLGSASY